MYLPVRFLQALSCCFLRVRLRINRLMVLLLVVATPVVVATMLPWLVTSLYTSGATYVPTYIHTYLHTDMHTYMHAYIRRNIICIMYIIYIYICIGRRILTSVPAIWLLWRCPYATTVSRIDIILFWMMASLLMQTPDLESLSQITSLLKSHLLQAGLTTAQA